MEDLDLLSESISTLYWGYDPDIEQSIFQCVALLPKEVQEFAIDRCRFFSVGGSVNAAVLNGNILLPPLLNLPEGIRWAIEQGRIEELLSNPPMLILLSEHIVDKYEREDIVSIIAHEIAHAYLGHASRSHSLKADEAHRAAEMEVEACELASSWGFSGRGTDAESRAAYFTDAFKQN
jgi:hypothetical protein